MPRKASLSPTRPPVVAHSPETRVRVSLEIPSSLFDLYAEQGIAFGRMPEDEILQRLHRCKEHNACKPLYLNDDQRAKLEKALGHNFTSAEVAIAQIVTAVSLQVGDVGVELPPRLTQRLSSRAKAERKAYEEVVRREVIKGLSVYAGLIPGY